MIDVERFATVVGCQVPRIECVPPYTTTSAAEAIELANMAGMVPDEWQCRVLDGALGRDAGGSITAPEVGLIVGRQNGKGGCIEIAALHGMYMRECKIVYTAHLMATSRKIRERIQFMIESVPDFDKEVRQIRTANEEQSIVLKSGARMDFVARTGSAARGWAAYDIIFFDEAFALTAEMIGALMPILFSRQNWQIWYASMGGMENSTALRQVRMRAINGDPELAYYEWSADEAYHDAPEYVANMPVAWAQANPALGKRISLKTIVRAQRAMDARVFGREVLCIWDDPGGMLLINPSQWMRLADRESAIQGGLAFSLDITEGLTAGAIGAAGYRADGIPHVELTGRDGVIDHRSGVDWIVPRAKELDAEWHPGGWVIDTSGPASALLPELLEARLNVIPVIGNGLVQATGAFLKAANAPAANTLRHLGQPDILTAIRNARQRYVGDGGWVFGRRLSGSDITPLTVVTLALHGLVALGLANYNVLESIY